MERWPIILWIGAAVLGRVGGEMMITDPWVHGLLNPSKGIEYTVQAFFIVFGLRVEQMAGQAPAMLQTSAMQPLATSKPVGEAETA